MLLVPCFVRVHHIRTLLLYFVNKMPNDYVVFSANQKYCKKDSSSQEVKMQVFISIFNLASWAQLGGFSIDMATM